MRLFLVIFFLIYGLFHLYAFLKTRSAFQPGAKWSILLILLMVVMVCAPVIVRLAENQGHELFARLMSYAGFLWMGLLFLFISCSLFIDCYRVILVLIRVLLKVDTFMLMPTAKASFYFPLLFAVLAGSYGYFEAKNIRTEHVTIKTKKIPAEVNRIKIVQISDVHIGLIVRGKRLREIIEVVRNEKPDMLVSTGDLVDGQINRLEGLSEMLREINPRYGKYAITGNHEFYAGLKQALEFTEQSGFNILRGESIDVDGIITLIGVDDRQGKTLGLFSGDTEMDLLKAAQGDKFILLLKHRPEFDRNTFGLFDLQLSGHTHKGQIFPFSLITRLYFHKDSGYVRLSDESHMYVSRGTGTWGPPIRFLSPPEVTVFELVHEE